MKTRMTEEIKQLVKDAKANMPDNAVNMRLEEKYHTKIGPLETYHNWTSIVCIYFDTDGKIVEQVELKKNGSWQFDSDPANFVLHNEGLWRPYKYDTWGHKLKHIREAYENLVNYKMIEPINGLTTPKYDCEKFCDKILNSDCKGELHLTFILDYDYAENRTDMKFRKEEYSIKGKVEYEDQTLNIPHMWATKIHIIYNEMINKLENAGFDDITIHYDMESADRKKIFNHLCWTDITF